MKTLKTYKLEIVLTIALIFGIIMAIVANVENVIFEL